MPPSDASAAKTEPTTKAAAVSTAAYTPAVKLSAKDAKTLKLLKSISKPSVVILKHAMRDEHADATRENINFTWDMLFHNKSSVQLSEITVVLQIKSQRNGKEVFRSDPHTFTEFHCDRVPNVGPLEAACHSTFPSEATFTVPSRLWTTDAILAPIIIGTKVVEDESDLHNSGNLISFMLWHTDDEIKSAFLKDPSLFQLKNSVGTNPAMIAMAERTPELVQFMLAHGVTKEGKTRSGHDMMYSAVQSDEPEMLEFATKLGFSVNDVMGDQKETPLMSAINSTCPDAMRWLLKHGADPNARDSRGDTALSFCIENISDLAEGMFNDLVKAKANVQYRLPNGDTLLHLAVGRGDIWSAKRLVELGVSVNAVNNNKETALMVAAITDCYDLAKWLIEKGADVHAVDAKGRTVFDYAKMSNTLNTDRFFREKVGL